MNSHDELNDGTESAAYADRLVRLQRSWWKRLLPVQLPYQLNLRSQRLGATLDVGCGLGRNLGSLPSGSLGVDHNEFSVEVAGARGLDAMTVTEFLASPRAREGSFDGLLLAHVLEHLPSEEAKSLLLRYLPYVRPGGTVFIVCPQEKGYSSDSTHVWFATDEEIKRLCAEAGLEVQRSYSFPLPRPFGRIFTYNEFCVRARRAI